MFEQGVIPSEFTQAFAGIGDSLMRLRPPAAAEATPSAARRRALPAPPEPSAVLSGGGAGRAVGSR